MKRKKRPISDEERARRRDQDTRIRALRARAEQIRLELDAKRKSA
jgi:hypothetical protein